MENANLSAEKRSKLVKIVIITLTPGRNYFGAKVNSSMPDRPEHFNEHVMWTKV
jgi:hypothetical protein